MLPTTVRDPRRCVLLISAVVISGRAFIVPGHLPRDAAPFSRVSCKKSPTKPISCWGVRRRLHNPCTASILPGDQDEDTAKGEDSDEDRDANAGSGGQEEGMPGPSAGSEAGDEVETNDSTFYGGPTMDENAPLALLSQGDTLPLSYRSDNGTRESEFYVGDEQEHVNPYYDVVRRLSPTELIGRFMRTSSPRVQEAVRTTVLGLLGSLPRHAFETTAIATGDALANLMFQLQMTGYMFKNAEYRLSLKTSMRAAAALPPGLDASSDGEDGEEVPTSRIEMDEDGLLQIARPQISGKIKLTYDSDQETERALEVDADAYMAELRGQVEQLESQLLMVQNQKEEAVQKDLLVYIKSMPEHQLQGLTAGVSPEVLESMRLLVETVMGGMGNSEILAQTLTQQTGSGMAQLCMWQLVVGFNLREMEAREDMRKNFNK